MRKLVIRVFAAVSAIVLVQACSGGGGGGAVSPGSAAIATSEVFVNLSFNQLVAFPQAPDDGSRWFAVQKSGQVLVFDNDQNVTAGDVTMFIDISGSVNGAFEQGIAGHGL